MIAKIIFIIVMSIILSFFVGAKMYLTYGMFKKLFHDILSWHEPVSSSYYHDHALHSTCKYCCKHIVKRYGVSYWE